MRTAHRTPLSDRSSAPSGSAPGARHEHLRESYRPQLLASRADSRRCSGPVPQRVPRNGLAGVLARPRRRFRGCRRLARAVCAGSAGFGRRHGLDRLARVARAGLCAGRADLRGVGVPRVSAATPAGRLHSSLAPRLDLVVTARFVAGVWRIARPLVGGHPGRRRLRHALAEERPVGGRRWPHTRSRTARSHCGCSLRAIGLTGCEARARRIRFGLVGLVFGGG